MLIGYAPFDRTLRHPSDRRRFAYYAARRGIPFEIADPAKSYDLVVVGAGADVSIWSRHAKSAHVIVELIDSYLAESGVGLESTFRGIAKFVLRQNRYLLPSYRAGLERLLRLADAVVCTTSEQRDLALRYCKDVHVILDCHEAERRTTKQSYRAGRPFHFVWEGLAENLRYFGGISELLRSIHRERPIVVHAITDLRYGRYLRGAVMKTETRRTVGRFGVPFALYQWHEATFAGIATSCDAAIIPVDLSDPHGAGKPENKLLLLWRLGLPAIVSATPANVRAMNTAGVDLACRTRDDWEKALLHVIDDEEFRVLTAARGKSCADTTYSEATMLARWDALLADVIGKVP
jgi:hypothetical protein